MQVNQFISCVCEFQGQYGLNTEILECRVCGFQSQHEPKSEARDRCICVFQNLYGLKPETLDSLILDFLPPLGHTYKELSEESVEEKPQEVSVSVYLYEEILNALRDNAGFHIPKVNFNSHSRTLRHNSPFYAVSQV